MSATTAAAKLEPARTWGIGAEFLTAAAVFHAAEQVRDRGFRRWDVYSPFPIHGMDKAMGVGKSWVSAVSLLGAATGLITAVLLEAMTSVYFYPIVVQGKPFFSLPAFVPVMFELTILLTAFGTVFGMLLFNLLPRYHHPVFNWDYFEKKATDDGFFIVIEASDPRAASLDATERFLAEIGGIHITRIPK
jgi:sterol desaturase/sphingolipid hydroxylase (fatty acid hydroxylase superfamily)